MKRIAVGFVLVLMASSAGAQSYRSLTGLTVTPIGPDRYEVSGVPSWGPADYWCSIGEFAQRVLRVDPNSRLFVVGDYVRGQRTYVFSTSAAGTASEAERVRSLSIDVDGANMRANAAFAECRNRRNIGRP